MFSARPDWCFVRTVDIANGLCRAVKRPQLCRFLENKKVRPAPGGGPAARKPGLGTGRGGDVTGLA